MLCKNPFDGFGCGQCLPCRINSRRVLTNRIMLESTLWDQNSFLTLTYDDEHLPPGNSLNRDHTTDFMKRLRQRLAPHRIRTFLVGEYGHEGARQWNPHYHAALFNFNCLGKIQRPETGPRCYCQHCELVRSAWGHGNITLDELNNTTADYIGGYVTKKMTDPQDTRLEGRYPEFSSYPMRPGLAADAVPSIATTLQSQYGHLAFKHGDIPHALARGRKQVPLGRYLKRKVRQAIGLEKINQETGEVTYGTPDQTIKALSIEASPELHALQQIARDHTTRPKDIFEKIDKQKSRDVSTRDQRILNLETKHKIYQSAKRKKL